jgi:hypothetical protein
MLADLFAPMAWLLVTGRPNKAVVQSLADCHLPQLHLLPQAADQEVLEQLWLPPLPDALQWRVQWLGAEIGERPWYSFNDSRFDGERPLTAWQATQPNLQLLAMELRPCRPLAAAVEGWLALEVDGGALLVQGTDFAACLLGGGPLLERLRLVVCWPDRGDVMLEEGVESLLTAAGLRQVAPLPPGLPVGALLWQRDEELVAQRRLRDSCDRLRAERDGLAAERDGLLAHCEGLVAERDGLRAERDRLAAERTDVQAERDALAARCADQQQRLARINDELDAILALIDSTAPVADALPESSDAAPLPQGDRAA